MLSREKAIPTLLKALSCDGGSHLSPSQVRPTLPGYYNGERGGADNSSFHILLFSNLDLMGDAASPTNRAAWVRLLEGTHCHLPCLKGPDFCKRTNMPVVLTTTTEFGMRTFIDPPTILWAEGPNNSRG